MFGTQRDLTDEERSELNELTAAIESAIAARTRWLDDKMHETSTLQVGDDIYDVDKGYKLGIVTQLYRYTGNDNQLNDRSPWCDYRYETSPGCIDNTSRQLGRSFGTKEDALRRAEAHAERLRSG